jgi:succinate dehydrogenase flavin-adding protein (antitoxin of CptAB toxin-antitoxin module)
VNLGGQICDREEMHTFESYFKRNKIKYVDPFFEIIKESHIGIRDVVSAVGIIKFLYKNNRECKDNKFSLLESFFKAYFHRLSPTYFQRWESLIDCLDNVILFYFDRDDALGKNGLKKLREWYRLEKEERKIEFTGL